MIPIKQVHAGRMSSQSVPKLFQKGKPGCKNVSLIVRDELPEVLLIGFVLGLVHFVVAGATFRTIGFLECRLRRLEGAVELSPTQRLGIFGSSTSCRNAGIQSQAGRSRQR